MRRPAPLVAAAACVLAAASVALAQDIYTDSVDLEVAASGGVKGTIRSATERESFVLDLPQGAVVSASAKRRGKGGLVPRLDLVGEDVPPATVVTKGKGSTLKGAPVPTSSFHRLRVFGDGTTDGDYQLKYSVKPQAKWRGTGSTVAAADTTTYRFAAPAGARAKISLRPAPGSAFVPALDALVPPSGAPAQPISGGSTGFLALGEGGTWTVRFRDGGTVGGEWVLDVTLRLPKVRPTKADISAGSLTGSFVDGQPVYGRLAGDGAALEVIADLGAIAGTSVTLEPGSLPVPVVITMSEVPPFDLPEGASNNGPTIQFGPEGTTFADGKPAKLTLPYDPTIAPEDLTIYVRDETTGEVVAVPKPYEFPGAGLVTFPAPHFSEYAATSSHPPGFTGRWVYAGIESEPQPDFGGVVRVTAGEVNFDVQGGWSYFGEGLESRWERAFQGQTGPEPRASTAPVYDSDGGGIEGGDDEIYLYGRDGVTTFRRSRRGDVMFQTPDFQNLAAQVGILVRAARGNPTALNLAGRWHVFALTAGASQDAASPGGPVELRLDSVRATAEFLADGRVRFTGITFTEGTTQYPAGAWTVASRKDSGTGRFRTSGPNVLLDLPDDQAPAKGRTDLTDDLPPDVVLRPALDGDVMVGSIGWYSGDEPTLFAFVRESTAGSGAVLVGRTTTFGARFETVDRPASVQGIRSVRAEAHVDHTAAGGLTVVPVLTQSFEHLTDGSPTVFSLEPPTVTGTWTVAKNGRYDSGPVRGAVTRRGGLFVGTRSDGTTFEVFFGVPGEELVPLAR